MTTYRIVRNHFNKRARGVPGMTGLSLAAAQVHCSNPKTHGLSDPHRPGKGRCANGHGVQSGDTCPLCNASLFHDWFDGYEAE